MRKTGEETDRLFAQAGEKYAAALAIKPDHHEALNNWGTALSAQARTKTGEEADRLFAQAREKYAAALAIKPDMHEALNSWGNALSDQAQTKIGEEADRLFAQAIEKYDGVEKISPGRAGYNLGCVAALMRDEQRCRNWFERSKVAGYLPTYQLLLSDDDLRSVRECQWFKDFLKDAYPDHA
jgi:Tfp pilus assembly protein PilF